MNISDIKMKKAFIFDFDGTLFHLFTTFNFEAELKMLDNEFKRLGFKFPDTWNPFMAFKVANDKTNPNRDEALIYSDNLLTKTELRYVDLGKPVNGAIETLKYLINNGYSVSIATNNSPLAVKRFLKLYLDDISLPIRGRIGRKPELLKPNPWMLNELAYEMKASSSDCVFIGDHPRDYECAKAAKMDFIPIAPADYKMERMEKIFKRSEIMEDLNTLLNIIRLK